MRLVLGEDRQRLQLRVAGGHENDVETEQGEENPIADGSPVPSCAPSIFGHGAAVRNDREQDEKGGVGRGVDEEERRESPGPRRDSD